MICRALHGPVSASSRGVFPRYYQRRRLRKLGASFAEPDLRLLPYLCERGKLSLDVGAAMGFYSTHLLRVSRKCVASEPRPEEARELACMPSSVAAPASVEAVALTDRLGESKLPILLADAGRNTIESAHLLQDGGASGMAEISVPVRRMDDYDCDNVGFIKIDVEGYEYAVLSGGRETVARNRPGLIYRN